MLVTLVALTLLDLPPTVASPEFEDYRGIAIVRASDAPDIFRLLIKQPGETWSEASGEYDLLTNYMTVMAVVYLGFPDRTYTLRLESHSMGRACVKGGQSETFDHYVNLRGDDMATLLNGFGLHGLY